MALTASPGEAANLGFLEKAPAGQFDETDWKLVRQAVQAALSDTSQEATRSWHNEANEHQGTVRILKSWQDSQGRPCRRFRLDNSAGGYKGSYTNDACQQADGNWVTQDGLRLSWRQRQPFPVDG
jgi:surface antigen